MKKIVLLMLIIISLTGNYTLNSLAFTLVKPLTVSPLETNETTESNNSKSTEIEVDAQTTQEDDETEQEVTITTDIINNTDISQSPVNVDLIKAAILVDGNSARVLYSYNSNDLLDMASITKLMTAIVLAENCRIDEEIIVPRASVEVGESNISLKEGEKLTVEQILNAIIVRSANDAAVAAAFHVSGNEEDFVKLMNQKALEIGAVNTTYMNSHGLTSENHKTTAYDTYLVVKYFMENPVLRSISEKVTYTIPPTNLSANEKLLYNTNLFISGNTDELMPYNGESVPIKYDKIVGGKTGNTSAAGNCLASYAKSEDRSLYAVVLGATNKLDIYTQTRSLVDYGLNNFNNHTIIKLDEVLKNYEVKGTISKVKAVTNKEIVMLLTEEEFSGYTTETILNTERLTAPINAGDEIGKVQIKYNDNILGEFKLFAQNSVKPNLISKYLWSFKTNPIISTLLSLVFMLFVYRLVIVLKKISRANKIKNKRNR